MTRAAVIARGAGIYPRTRKATVAARIPESHGSGASYSDVLAVLARSDLTPNLDTRVHTVAYALRKSMVTGRMNPVSSNRIAAYTPYEMCKLVALIVDECPETTIGGICDLWIPRNHERLVMS